METFINKRVCTTVSFSSYTVDGGAISGDFIGILEKCDGDYIELSSVQKVVHTLGGVSYRDYSGRVVINKQYLIMIAEV